MTNFIEQFNGIENVEFADVEYVKELDTELPVFVLTDIAAERWNSIAKKSNTKAFIDANGRLPENYKEVLSWVHSLFSEGETGRKFVTEDYEKLQVDKIGVTNEIKNAI